MDPNAVLSEARDAVTSVRRYDGSDPNQLADAAETLADSFAALDGWLTKGGPLPEAWQRPEELERPYAKLAMDSLAGQVNQVRRDAERGRS